MLQDFRVRIGSRLKKLAGMTLCVVFLCVHETVPESVQITAYFPVPYGVYKNLSSADTVRLAYGLAASRVGIGTTDPQAKLDVNGVNGLDGWIELSGTPSGIKGICTLRPFSASTGGGINSSRSH